MSNVSPNECREAFEEWCKKEGYRTEGRHNPLLNRKDYTTVTTYSAWYAWQASRTALCKELVEKSIAIKRKIETSKQDSMQVMAFAARNDALDEVISLIRQHCGEA